MVVPCGSIWFLVLPSKMDANKKVKSRLKINRDSKFVFKFTFSYLKFCYLWRIACLANFSRGVTAKKLRTTDIYQQVLVFQVSYFLS